MNLRCKFKDRYRIILPNCMWKNLDGIPYDKILDPPLSREGASQSMEHGIERKQDHCLLYQLLTIAG